MNSLDIHIRRLELGVVRDVFRKHSISATIDSISLEKIPEAAMNVFEGYSRRFILPEEYLPWDFDQSFVINHDDGVSTFVVSQIKTYWDGAKERLTYIVDLDTDDTRLSHAELRFKQQDERSYFKDKPFSGWNGCDNDIYIEDRALIHIWVEQGIRQLMVMNALSHALYGLPLHSDTIITTHERPLWRRLDREGKVVRYKEGTNRRYAFTTIPGLYVHNNN